MNNGEYGILFLLDTNFTLPGYLTLSMTFTKPSGATLGPIVPPDLSVGAVDYDTETKGIFQANEYVSYTFQNGDVNEAGLWSVRLTRTDSTPRTLISDPGQFTIHP